jgi:hypothetical protein
MLPIAPSAAPAVVNHLLGISRFLSDDVLALFAAELARDPRFAAAGWRIGRYQPRGERKKARNDRIRKDHARGLSPGQIAKKEGTTRNAVRMVLYLDKKRAAHVQSTCDLQAS